MCGGCLGASGLLMPRESERERDEPWLPPLLLTRGVNVSHEVKSPEAPELEDG